MGNIRGKIIRTVAAAGLACGLIAGANLAGPLLIVALGVKAVSALSVVSAAAGAGLVLWSAGDLALGIRKEQKAIEEKRSLLIERQDPETVHEDKTSPEATRARLNNIMETTPGLKGLIKACLNQMDMMDELQDRQNELIGLNQAAYLKDTVGTLDSVEKEICLNLRGIVNQCIIAGKDADESSIDLKKSEAILEKNKVLLDQSKELLAVSADWIDQYNAKDKGADRSILENWIKVINETIHGEGLAIK